MRVKPRDSSTNESGAHCPAGVVRGAGEVPAEDGADQGEGEDDKETDAGDGHHGAEGDGPAGVVVDGDEVDEEGGAADHGGQDEGGDDHLLDPHLPAHPGIETAPEVAIDWSCGCVDKYRRGEEGASLGVELAQDGHQDDEEDDHRELSPGPYQAGEEKGRSR